MSNPLAALQVGLRGASARQAVAAANIANANVPGYRARAVRFGEDLQRALERRDEAATRAVQPRIVDKGGPVRANGNNVDLDGEITELHQAGVQHAAVARLVDLTLTRLRLAVGN